MVLTAPLPCFMLAAVMNLLGDGAAIHLVVALVLVAMGIALCVSTYRFYTEDSRETSALLVTKCVEIISERPGLTTTAVLVCVFTQALQLFVVQFQIRINTEYDMDDNAGSHNHSLSLSRSLSLQSEFHVCYVHSAWNMSSAYCIALHRTVLV